MSSSRTVLVIAAMIAALSAAAFPQSGKIDISALVDETQKSSPAKDDMTIVWWIPLEFWQATLADENMSKAQIDEVLGVLRPYILVAVVDGRIGDAGKVTYRSGHAIAKDIRLVTPGRPEQTALSPEKVGPGMTTLLKTMQPILSNILGSVGANMHFVVFSSSDQSGAQLVDVNKPGSFSLRLEPGRVFTWRLPLASMSPQKICPVDGEKHPSNWRYCPFHGVELKN